MTQHDYNVGNATFPSLRADVNNALAAILSLNSGTSAPSTTAAGMLWYDTTNGILKQRNAADSAWLHLWSMGKHGLVDQNGSTVYAADGGASDAYAITLTPAPTAYATGQVFSFKANTANTGAASLNVNGLGAKTIKKNYNSDLATGDILANQMVLVEYDGTNFQVLSHLSTAQNATVSAVTSRSSNTIWGLADSGTLFVCTSTFTQTITSAATLGSTWYCFIRNDGSGVITIDPNSSQTIDGATTTLVYPGEAFMIVCDGSNFKTVGRQRSGLILLGTATASASATVDFTSFINSDFDEYILMGSYVVPATDGVNAYVRFSTDGGSSFLASTTYSYHGIDTTGNLTSGTGAAQIILNRLGIGNADGEGLDFELRFSKPSGGQAIKGTRWLTNYRNTGSGDEGINGAATVATASAVNAVRFLFSSGNVAQGSFKLYGVRG